MKNNNLTLLDPNQIVVNQHDPTHDAQRVVIVGDTGTQIADSIREGLTNIQINLKHPDSPIQTTPTVQFQTIEIPSIIKEIEYREIERPVFIENTKIIEVEKPVFITTTKTIEVPLIIREQQEFPKILVWLFGAQIILSLIGLFFHR